MTSNFWGEARILPIGNNPDHAELVVLLEQLVFGWRCAEIPHQAGLPMQENQDRLLDHGSPKRNAHVAKRLRRINKRRFPIL